MIDRDQLWKEPLTWRRTGPFARESELLAGGERVASLRRRGFFSRDAEVETPEGRWRIERRSWMRRDLALLDPDSGREIATFHDRWLGRGVLTLENGDTYTWRPLDFWHVTHGFVRENGEPVVRVRNRSAFRLRAEITVDPDRRSERDLMAMVMIAGYLFGREKRRSGA